MFRTSMRIGYHDHIFPSGLSPAIVVAAEDGRDIVPYNRLPGDGEEAPPVMIINPIASMGKEYWEGIRACVASHPKTKFFMFMPVIEEAEHARQVLAGQGNVDYIEQGDSKKIRDVLEGRVNLS